MGFILSLFKFFTLSSGFVSTRDDPALEPVRQRRREYDRIHDEVETGDPLQLQISLEQERFLLSHNFDDCPLLMKYGPWTQQQWETYRFLHPVPPRSLR